MKFIVYGSGCSKCHQLAANVKEAANAVGVSFQLEKVSDMKSIVDAGIMRTPALSLDNKIAFEGKVASVDEIKKLLV